MFRKNIKSKIATLLVASMFASMLAPSVSVQASTQGKINFNTGIWGKYDNGVIDSLQGTPTTIIKDTPPYNNSVNYPVSGSKLKLPYIVGENSFAGKAWNTDGFKGYKIQGWYTNNNENLGTFEQLTLPTRFPAGEITYYPKYVSDGTTYTIRTEHGLSTNLSGITGNFSIPNDSDMTLKVLEGFQTVPKVVDGFKIKSGFPTTTFYQKGTQTVVAPPVNSNNFDIRNENGYVSGSVVNKDLVVKYEYDIDTTVQFPITVIHHFLQADGTEKVPADNLYVPAGAYTAGQAVSDVALKPDQSKITAVAPSIPMYVLAHDTTKATGINNTNFVPKFTRADGSAIQDKATLNQSMILHPTDTGLQINTTDTNPTTAGAVSGNMPNMGLQLHYYYVPNPDYALNVRVKYVDDLDQNITHKVVEALGNNVLENYDANHPSHYYKVMSGTILTDIESRVQPATAFEVPAPTLPQYTENVESNVTVGKTEFDNDNGVYNATSRTPVSPKFTGTMGTTGKSIEITVKYSFKEEAKGTLLIDTQGDGELQVNDQGTIRPYNSGTDAITKEVNTGNKIVIENAELPTPVPGLGYIFDGWYLGNTKVTNFPVEIAKTGNVYRIKAKFEKNPAQWKKFIFKEGNNDPNIAFDVFPDPADVEVNMAAAQDGGGTLNFDYIDAQGLMPTVTHPANYTVVWQDANGVPILNGDNLSGYPDGTEFFAIADYTGAAVANNPSATGALSSTGTPQIRIENRNPVASVKYLVVDENGNIVGIQSSSEVAANGGNIVGNFLSPDSKYKVYEALPTTMATVGTPITDYAAPDISTTPADVSIPLANDANVVEDPNHTGKARIIVSPVAPNTEYALVDDQGNEVFGFAAPTGNDVKFDNLEPNRTYTVVARPLGSTESAPDKIARGYGLPVNTANLGLSATEFDVVVHYPVGAEPSVKIGGVTKTLADLVGIRPGTEVEIAPAGTDQNGNFFSSWSNIGPAPSVSRIRGNTYIFTMPAHGVKMQAIYESLASWSNAEYYNTTSESPSRRIGAVNPDIQEAGDYKLRITKSALPGNVKSNIDQVTGFEFKNGWMMHIEVLKFNTLTNMYELYTGNVPQLLTTVETGALLSTKNYRFLQVDPSDTLVNDMTSSVINDWNDLSYQGSFDVNLENNGYYAFGYNDANAIKVRVYDSRNNHLLTTIEMFEMESIGDHADKYNDDIVADYVDGNGVTFSYKGLSRARDHFDEQDPNIAITEDMDLYLYYEDDKELRKQTADELSTLLKSGERMLNNGNLTAESIVKLQDALNRLGEVLKKTSPRKSSTPELQAAIDALTAVLADMNIDSNSGNSGNSSHSGGSSGGSGGGGSIRRNGTTGKTRILSVGIDGNWELVNPETHEWVFNLESGNRTKGWNLLSYTYNGKLRSDWYYFADNNIMRDGWLWDDTTNKWYYLSEVHDGFFGKMNTGWHYDQNDNKWYYLDEKDGSMKTGWQNINGIWYYLNPTTPAPTWEWNADSGKWVYNNTQNVRPLGSMFSNEITPDGFKVDASGAWVK